MAQNQWSAAYQAAVLPDFPFPVPDPDEQRRVIAEILPLEDEIEKLQQEIDNLSTKKQAILDKYLK